MSHLLFAVISGLIAAYLCVDISDIPLSSLTLRGITSNVLAALFAYWSCNLVSASWDKDRIWPWNWKGKEKE